MSEDKAKTPQPQERDVVPPKGEKSYTTEVPPVRDDNTGGSTKGNQSYPVEGK